MVRQAVNGHIASAHPEAVQQNIYTLIVDGSNLLRICLRDGRINMDGMSYGGFFQFFIHLKQIMGMRDFDYIYVFWDGDLSGQLRYDLYPMYKANRGKNYNESEYDKRLNDYVRKVLQHGKDVRNSDSPSRQREEAERERYEREKPLVMKALEELFVRQISVEYVEGDDLMAYYVMNKLPNEKVVILSTDRDLSQLLSDDVCIYDTLKKKSLSYANHRSVMGYHPDNVVLKKILCGDSSDNIKGVKGVGEASLFKFFPEIKDRKVTLEEVINRAKERIAEIEKENEGKKTKKSQKKPPQMLLNIVNGVSLGMEDGEVYSINDKIINLRKPLLTEEAIAEMDNLIHKPIDPEGRDYRNLYAIIRENKMQDLLDTERFSNFFFSFERIAWKEKKRFEEFQNSSTTVDTSI